mmetsp:Transcript_22581/g.40722  ORF Transcript_22581/g.40722 Transcript_22581/m.40722 type:complete len:123 (+) Transcript_22581:616-984(+)
MILIIEEAAAGAEVEAQEDILAIVPAEEEAEIEEAAIIVVAEIVGPIRAEATVVTTMIPNQIVMVTAHLIVEDPTITAATATVVTAMIPKQMKIVKTLRLVIKEPRKNLQWVIHLPSGAAVA